MDLLVNHTKDQFIIVIMREQLQELVMWHGIVAANQYTSDVSNCYNIGNITGSSNTGSIIGWTSANAICTNSYYLTGTASYGIGNTSSDVGAEPRTAVVMKTSAFVALLEGQDEEKNWKIVANTNNGYPILEWQEGAEIQVAWYSQKGLLLHYDGIENTSNGHSNSVATWYDLSGKGNNGTVNNSATWNNNYLSFDGTDDYISITNNPLYKNKYTINFVVLGNTLSSHTLYSNRSSMGTGISIFWLNTGNIRFDTGATTYQWNTGIAVPVSNINVITLTKNSIGRKMYLNGNEVATTTTVGDSTGLTNGITTIGVSQTSGASFSNYFSGSIYSYMVYDRVLTNNEIKENYKLNASRFGIN